MAAAAAGRTPGGGPTRAPSRWPWEARWSWDAIDPLWSVRWLILILLTFESLRHGVAGEMAPARLLAGLGLIAVTVVANVILRVAGLRLRNATQQRHLALWALGIDLTLITAFVLLHLGEPTSSYGLLFPVVIIEAGMVLGLRGALATWGVAALTRVAEHAAIAPRFEPSAPVPSLWFGIVSLLLVAVTTGLLADRLARQQLRLAAAVAERDRELRWRQGLLDMLAHDLRAPMATAFSTAELVAARAPDLDASQLAMLNEATQRQIRRALRLLDDLLDLGRARAGMLEIHREPVDLLAFVRATLDELPDRFAAGVRLETQGPNPVVAVADPGRLSQVLWNLLTNAEKHGAPPVTVRVVAPADRDDADDADDKVVALEVLDRGSGVPARIERALFEPFRTTGGDGSTGLGLWIARLLTTAQGGSLDYARQDGLTRFVVRLPADPAAPSAGPSATMAGTTPH